MRLRPFSNNSPQPLISFNTDGFIKASDCDSKIAPSTCDLYTLENKPQPIVSDFPTIWPIPQTFKNGTATVQLSSEKQFSFVLTTGTSEILQEAFERYHDLTFPHVAGNSDNSNATLLSSLKVTVDNLDESYPQLETDESYTLQIPSDGSAATLHAATIYGAMHGLETFSQLVYFDFETENFIVEDCPWTIDDAPRFPHRGLMMDTARHFEPLESIRDIIDSLPYAKINVLHWHMSDSQSFPMQSKTSPKLWDGAWSSIERYTQVTGSLSVPLR